MPQRTRIERLDQEHPGLADQVRAWFDQARTVKQVSALIQAHYGVFVWPDVVGNFRRVRWVREREEAREKRLTAAALAEFRQWLALARAGAGKN